ncbi:MAG: peroxiredoxin [Pyrinomonadaceae bacterium]
MKVGENAPDFALEDQAGNHWRLSEKLGKPVVLLFYPADNTPVCTAQMCSVRDNWDAYSGLDAEVVGISTDDVESHAGFATKHELPLTLLADIDAKVSKLYGATSWIPGRSARAVVVVDGEGRIAYHKVQSLSIFRPNDEEIVEAVRALG